MPGDGAEEVPQSWEMIQILSSLEAAYSLWGEAKAAIPY